MAHQPKGNDLDDSEDDDDFVYGTFSRFFFIKALSEKASDCSEEEKEEEPEAKRRRLAEEEEEKTRIEREAAELWESLCPKQSSPHVTRSTVPTTSTTTKRVSGKVHPPLETPIAGKSAKQLAEEATASAKPQKEQSVTYRFCGESIVVPQDTKRKRGADVVSLLGTSKGKKKISTLQKSSLDWQNFKSKNNLDDELEQQTKDGFLERQAFLARSDLRQFEVEKQVRNTDRRLRERKR
eukprot:TRINITY_DN4707_c0_g1_i12.p1 TRINITY_DN4707_c0_g1~~TRINITY_DN4707_c0_g1_i12.p1  ORF type:complete len:263 (+),score=67.95 TRINITY_DN4707_c0_g1_i12:76-789(+)